MPQLLFPGNSVAIGIETALIVGVTEMYGFTGAAPNMTNLLLAGAAVAAWNFMYNNANTTGVPPTPPPKGRMGDLNHPSILADNMNMRDAGVVPWTPNVLAGYGIGPTSWATSSGPSVNTLVLQNVAAALWVEYMAGTVAAFDILAVAVVTYL